MKKHFKQLLITLFIAVCSVCFAFGLAACDKGGDGGSNGPTALQAPVLDLSGTVLSWSPVEHATGYQVYENGTRKADTTATSYQIPPTTLAVEGVYEYTVKAVSSDPNYTTSPESNKKQYLVTIQKTQLEAPAITVDAYSGLISWDEVDNADGYYVFENGTRVTNVRLEENYYQIGKKEVAGDYEYTVQAVSTNTKFSESEQSAPITFTVEELEAPEIIETDEENAIIKWTSVLNAESYNVYVDDSRIAGVNDTMYEISSVTPGEHVFTIAAASGSVKYTNSPMSEPETFNVPIISIIRVEIPAIANPNGTGAGELTLTVGLYNGAECVVSDNITVPYSNEATYTSVKLIAPIGNYLAKVEGLDDGYVATSAHIDKDNLNGTITILEKGDNELTVGSHTETVTLSVEADDESGSAHVTKQYIFIAGTNEAADGIYTIQVNESDYTDKTIRISVNGSRKVDTALSGTTTGIYSGSFTAEEGEVIVISVEYVKTLTTDSEEVSFKFEILASEVKQSLKVLEKGFNDYTDEEIAERDSQVNYITGSCTLYIDSLAEETKLSFFFSPTTGDRTIKITIDGKTYTKISSGILHITVAAGTDIKVEIEVTGSGYGGSADYVAFWVYPTPDGENEG